MIKVAIIAPYPASSVLSDEYLKARVRDKAKQQHPAPWVRSLCRELSSINGIEIRVFTHSRHISKIYSSNKEGVNYTFIPKYESARFDPYHLYFPAILQFIPLIRKFNPDIVHGFGAAGAYGLTTVMQDKPRVVFIQGIVDKLAPFSHKFKLKLDILKGIEKYVVKNADGIIVETEFARTWVKNISPNANVKIIPHGFTKSFFSAKPTFGSKKIVSIGTLSRIKGCKIVLKAFALGVHSDPALFNDAELTFIGSGPQEAALNNMIDNYGLRGSVRIMGHLAHEKIIHEMENACMLVIASRMDTSPNVITEAHAAGIPVIGTATGGIPNMIEDGKDGFLVPVDDTAEISSRMKFLLNDMQRCAKMGQLGREKVLMLNDPSIVAGAHVDFYQQILS